MAKILVVEDDPIIRRSVKDWMTFDGHEVFMADNGVLGLEIAHQEKPDLIISDIRMPEMDGHEFLLEVRANPQLHNTSFIFLTASADHDSIRQGIEMGADDYLTKPFTVEDLLGAVKARLEKRAARMSIFEQQQQELEKVIELEREKFQFKSRAVAMFSHDFRTPLALIMTSIQLLEIYGDITSERQTEHFSRIKGNVHHLVQMLDDMLVVAQIENNRLPYYPEFFAITKHIEAVIKEFRLIHSRTHTITFHSNVLGKVRTDPNLLRHVAVNLISNAVKYSPKQSTVHVKLETADNSVVLSVQDEGIGISEENIPHLFKPFHRAENAQSAKGTGLGLSIVQAAAKQCQGSVSVDSQLDQGSTFTFQFPLVTPEATP